MRSSGRVGVTFVENERVVARGVARTTWYVRRETSWVRASAWPDSETERGTAGAGTVWERVVRVLLPPGTRVLSVEERPRPTPRKDPFAYLRAETRSTPRVVRRTLFRVEGDGRLAHVPSTPRRAR